MKGGYSGDFSAAADHNSKSRLHRIPCSSPRGSSGQATEPFQSSWVRSLALGQPQSCRLQATVCQSVFTSRLLQRFCYFPCFDSWRKASDWMRLIEFLLPFYPTPDNFWFNLKAPNFFLAIDESFDRWCEDFQDDQPEDAKELEGKLLGTMQVPRCELSTLLFTYWNDRFMLQVWCVIHHASCIRKAMWPKLMTVFSFHISVCLQKLRGFAKGRFTESHQPWR